MKGVLKACLIHQCLDIMLVPLLKQAAKVGVMLLDLWGWHSQYCFFFLFLFLTERDNSNGQPPKLVPQCMAQSVEVTATKQLHQGSIGAYWL